MIPDRRRPGHTSERYLVPEAGLISWNEVFSNKKAKLSLNPV